MTTDNREHRIDGAVGGHSCDRSQEGAAVGRGSDGGLGAVDGGRVGSGDTLKL